MNKIIDFHPYRLFLTLALSTCLALTLAVGHTGLSEGDSFKGVDVEAVEKSGVRVWTERGCGSTYEIGESLTIKVRSERSGYLTLFDLTPSGEVQILFPNRYQQDNYVQGGKTYEVPRPGDPFRLRIGLPRGIDYILATVTEKDKQLVREDFSYYSQAFPKLQDSRKEVVNQVQKGVDVISKESWWAADSCHFHVGSQGAKPGEEPVVSEPSPEDSPAGDKMPGRVLLIGIDEYSNVEIKYMNRRYQFPPLDYSVKDARDMKELMEQNFTDVRLLIDEQATYEKVKSAVENWLGSAEEDELALLYFSGHGALQTDMNGDEPDGLDEVLVPHGYSQDKKFIVDDQIDEWLTGLPAEGVVYIADSCHAGTSSKAVRTFYRPGQSKGTGDAIADGIGSDLRGGGSYSTKGGTRQAIVALEASQPGQSAHEDDTFRQGVFTHYLLEGLRGAGDANGDGRITTWEAYNYSKGRVESHTKDKQEPLCSGCEEEDFCLSLVRRE